MNDAASMVVELGSTTKMLIVTLVPVGEMTFGTILALCVLGLIVTVVALSFRSALK